jgi:hypothetical protein
LYVVHGFSATAFAAAYANWLFAHAIKLSNLNDGSKSIQKYLVNSSVIEFGIFSGHLSFDGLMFSNSHRSISKSLPFENGG